MSAQAEQEWDPARYEFSFPAVRYEGLLAAAPVPFKVWKVAQFLSTVLREATSCLAAGAELPPLLTGLAAVDYIAGFYVGRQTTRKDYIAFVERFLPGRYQPHLDAIYRDLRCGLMHNLVVGSPWKPEGAAFLIVRDRADHLAVVDDRTVFSVLTFLEDVRRAWWKYAYHIVMLPDAEPLLQTRFAGRFNRLGGTKAIMVQVAE